MIIINSIQFNSIQLNFDHNYCKIITVNLILINHTHIVTPINVYKSVLNVERMWHCYHTIFVGLLNCDQQKFKLSKLQEVEALVLY